MHAPAVPAVVLIGWLALTACSRNPDVSATASEAPSVASERVTASQDGAPRIVLTDDGVHVQYRVYGAGDPAVVLVHGWSCDSSYWNAQVRDLATQYTVVTLDLAGHGASGRNRSEWTLARYAEDVMAAVREIDARHIVLVGHSMGGPVALEAASRLDDRVLGIIGVDTFRQIDQPPPAPAVIERQIETLRRDFIGATRELVTKTLFTADADPQLVRSVADDMSLAPPEVAIASIAALNAASFAEPLSKIEVPIVAINSDLPPATDEARIRRTVPQFRAVIIENTGHFLMMEAPERFNPALRREIARLASGSEG